MNDLFSMDLDKLGIKTVFFDFGGVMADFITPANLKQLSQVAQVSQEPFERSMWKHRMDFDSGKLGYDDYWNTVLSECQSPVNTQDNRHLLFCLDTVGFSHIRVKMVQFVHDVHKRGLKTALVSNMAKEAYEYLVKDQVWASYFDALVISGIIGHSKPGEAIYKYALQQCNASVESVLFIDDMQKNLDQAALLGMQTYLMRN